MTHNQNAIIHDGEYKQWITALKAKVKQSQLKAALAVNQQLLMFYWEMGNQIIEKQKNTA